MDRAQEPTAQGRDAPREPHPVGDRVRSADRIVDDLLPGDFDWRETVRGYPLPALLAAAAGGFFLAQRHGRELLAAVRGFVDREVGKNVQSFLGEVREDSQSSSGR